MTTQPQRRLLRLKQVCEKTGKSRSAIYADIDAGFFPAPVPIGSRSVAWVEQEIDEWIEARVAQRNAVSSPLRAAQ